MNYSECIQEKRGYYSRHTDESEDIQLRAKELCWRYNQTNPRDFKSRKEILEELFGTCSERTFIEPDFRCDYGFNIHTYGLTVINYNCSILDTSPVKIGANAFIGPGTCLACSGHALDASQRAEGVLTSKPIILEEDVWIGANVTVMGGVTIGKGSIIGAGSVVNHDIPAGVIAAGVPCKVIRAVTEADRLNISFERESVIFMEEV